MASDLEEPALAPADVTVDVLEYNGAGAVAGAAAASTSVAVAPAGAWPGAAVWGLASCRRRAAREVSSSAASGLALSTAYSGLVASGRALPEAEQEKFAGMAWWSEAETDAGARAFVLAPRGSDGDLEGSVDMWKLLAYALSQMHDRVVERSEQYAVVWVQAGDHRVSPWSAWRFRRSLHQRYFDNLDAVHVVHPSWSVRLVQLALWPLVEDRFWDSLYCHERVEFLDTHFPIKQLALPNDIYDYDAFLDKEAKFMSDQAAMHFGGKFDADRE